MIGDTDLTIQDRAKTLLKAAGWFSAYLVAAAIFICAFGWFAEQPILREAFTYWPMVTSNGIEFPYRKQ